MVLIFIYNEYEKGIDFLWWIWYTIDESKKDFIDMPETFEEAVKIANEIIERMIADIWNY